ncbi:uncharacterized protein C20orf96 homolog isoform X2 [Meriones unguiculatus]|uniref:uncharacterized protein C20orf96 homolog isoform X2 n=2 Tax=Meriones unguiculatus TaxID=10047 RepID=UPI00293E683F|nr:uncharacterized protein C20orf96 homolog isoform X2 [Meriones unguiculatus]
MAQKNRSSGSKFQVLMRESKPGAQWSESLKLPPLQQAKGNNKSTMKSGTKVQSAQSQNSAEVPNPAKAIQGLRRREQVHRGKTHSKVRLMRLMLRNQRATLQELYNHEAFLSNLNQELVNSIQNMEDRLAGNVRAMLQQQGVLGNIIDVLEYSNKRRLQQLWSELEEWKENEERKTNSLQQEVDQLNAEVQKAQGELSYLNTYMDHEYSIKSVEITNHMRQVQQAKDSQQTELDHLREMRRVVLSKFSDMIQEKKKKILRSLVAETQKPHEEMLVLKNWSIQRLKMSVVSFRELIEQLKKDIPVLIAEVEQIYAKLWNPREVIFQDVLLQRPKCTPDMAVELNIPAEELFLF